MASSSLHVIDGWTICLDGLLSYYHNRRRVPDDQIATAKGFLSQCRRTRWARELISPASHDLKHFIESWAGQYISNGAVLIATMQLGLTFVPYAGRSALIGIEFASVAELMAARGWYVAPDHVTPSRIKPPSERSPEPTEEQWRAIHTEVAKQMGISSLDEFYKLVSELRQEYDKTTESNDVRF